MNSIEAVPIRPATEADLDVVVDQLWEVAAEGRWTGTEVPFDRLARRERFADMVAGPAAVLLVAEDATVPPARIVGHIGVRVAPYGVADIGMLVRDGSRGRGVGSALLDAAIAWASAAGAHKMSLEVWPHNAAALALYRRAGFVEEGRRLRHYRRRSGEVWDAVLMGRPLTGGPGRDASNSSESL